MYILKTGGGIVESLNEAGTSMHSMPANTRGSRGMPPRKISYENQIAIATLRLAFGDIQFWTEKPETCTCNSGYRHAAARIYFNSIAISAFRYTAAACMAIIIQLHEVAMIMYYSGLSNDIPPAEPISECR